LSPGFESSFIYAFSGFIAINAGGISNQLNKMVKNAPEQFGKYASVLQQAANRGGTSLAATNYVLQQSDPEYRQRMKELDKESQND